MRNYRIRVGGTESAICVERLANPTVCDGQGLIVSHYGARCTRW
jgi:hypothetical protein